MIRSDVGKPRGVLNINAGDEKNNLSRRAPSPDLAFFIEHYWIIEWDLRGREPYTAEVLSHPSIHVAFENGKTGIFGVVRGKFTRTIEGEGKVFGIKFKPGAFYPFIKTPISKLTNRSLPISTVFPVDDLAIEQEILTKSTEEDMIAIAENMLRQKLPAQDEKIVLINDIVRLIISNIEITKVDDIANKTGLNKRSLQRLFSQYVGISPKWMIQRYRLHEAVEQLDSGRSVDLARLAVDLGYFDQPHFINDFKMLIGKSPAEYSKIASEAK
jgi:AraC-like DNA-binding protein